MQQTAIHTMLALLELLYIAIAPGEHHKQCSCYHTSQCYALPFCCASVPCFCTQGALPSSKPLHCMQQLYTSCWLKGTHFLFALTARASALTSFVGAQLPGRNSTTWCNRRQHAQLNFGVGPHTGDT
jgi:hypothetical protein